MRDEKPVRVQLRRTKGWRMPDNTVSVARPTKWGNPERVVLAGMHWDGESEDADGEPIETGPWLCLAPGSTWPPEPLKGFGGSFHSTRTEAAARAVEKYRWRMATDLPASRHPAADDLHELRGKNLACWCPLDQPCHADVLLELANKDTNHDR